MPEIFDWFRGMTVGGVGAWGGLIALVTLLIRQRPIMQKIMNDREGNLLHERTRDMRGMRRRIAQLEAEQRVDRHILGNIEQCFEALLMMIELNPEKAQEAAAKARAMRDEQKKNEAVEKGQVISAAVEAIGVENGKDD